MSDNHDSDPLAGPLDDEPDATKPDATKPAADIPKTTPDDDGSEWKLEPEPTEGDGPLP